MTHQNLSLGKYCKLLPATLTNFGCLIRLAKIGNGLDNNGRFKIMRVSRQTDNGF